MKDAPAWQLAPAFGAGLFGSGSQLLGQYQSGQVGALNPFTTYLGAGSTLEQLGQQPFEMGSLLGGRSAQAGGNVGQALLTGGISAARAQQAGAYNPFATALSGLSNNQSFQQGLEKYFAPSPFATSAFSDSYQASIPVNNQSSGYY